MAKSPLLASSGWPPLPRTVRRPRVPRPFPASFCQHLESPSSSLNSRNAKCSLAILGITCFALLLTQTLHAQETPAATNSATAVTPFSVIYTGRLLGYFRYPDQQSLDRDQCPQE